MYISAHPTASEPRPSLQSFVNTSRERSVLPLLLSIAALCQPFFQFNDEVERRDLPEQGFWASPKSHWDGVNQRLFEFVEALPTYLSLAEPKPQSPSRLACVSSRGPSESPRVAAVPSP